MADSPAGWIVMWCCKWNHICVLTTMDAPECTVSRAGGSASITYGFHGHSAVSVRLAMNIRQSMYSKTTANCGHLPFFFICAPSSSNHTRHLFKRYSINRVLLAPVHWPGPSEYLCLCLRSILFCELHRFVASRDCYSVFSSDPPLTRLSKSKSSYYNIGED